MLDRIIETLNGREMCITELGADGLSSRCISPLLQLSSANLQAYCRRMLNEQHHQSSASARALAIGSRWMA